MTASFSLGARRVGAGNPVFVIAEAGVNHNGEVDMARRLVAAGAAAGADAVKFQAFTADAIVSPDAPKAEYQRETTPAAESQLAMLSGLELDEEGFRAIADECREHGVEFVASAFDDANAQLLAALGACAIKVGSGELTNGPLLVTIAETGKPVILSTGMSDLEEVEAAVDTLRGAGASAFALLHCVSQYPADPAEANLRAIGTLGERFGVPVGFSDHTTGTEVAVAAVALGATIVEKHLTLDRSLAGPDHRASLEPDEFASLVRAIRVTSAALGDGVKRPAPSEAGNRAIVRRSLFVRSDLPAGTRLERDMLVALRPGTGIPPTREADVVGRRLARSVTAGEQLDWSDLE